MTAFSVAAFYRFLPLEDLPELRRSLKESLSPFGLRGTILIAPEGVNGTMAGSLEAIEGLVAELERRFALPRDEIKFSHAETWPFQRLKIRIRPEIITMRAPEADPSRTVGTYVEASEWNALVADPEVLLLDTRNRYETKVGGFAGALDPAIDSFTEFKAFVEERLDPSVHKKVAMFCTGGIRCEKASSFMLAKGFESVFHLKGGILKYLEEVPAETSRWEGECYVFDGRVAVGHGLAQTDWTACFACGAPLSEAERASPAFEPGVSCPACVDRTDEAKKAALRERHRQLTSG